MRQEKTLKPVANFGIRDHMKMEFKEGSPKFLLISATDFSDEKPQLRTMGFKFKTDDICAAFKKAFDDAAGSSNQESSKVDDEDDKEAIVVDKRDLRYSLSFVNNIYKIKFGQSGCILKK